MINAYSMDRGASFISTGHEAAKAEDCRLKGKVAEEKNAADFFLVMYCEQLHDCHHCTYDGELSKQFVRFVRAGAQIASIILH